MEGVLFSILGGILISFQGVFSSRISSKIGLWETNTIVHLAGLLLTLLMLLWKGDGNLTKFHQVKGIYFIGAFLGAFIIFCVIKGISNLGPTLAVAILLITQLVVAMVIDCWGLFETTPMKFHFTKPLGLVMMILGIIVFKLKG